MWDQANWREQFRRARFGARTMLGAIAAMAVVALAGPAAAQAVELQPEAAPTRSISAPVDHAVALHAVGPIGKVVASQPDIIQADLVDDDDLFVIGRENGTTNLLVFDRDGRLAERLDVHVGYDAEALRESLKAALPDERITVTALSAGVILEGDVSTPSAAEIALALAERAAPGAVTSRIHVVSNMVRLEVRMIETSSWRMKEIATALSVSDGRHLALGIGGAATPSATPNSTLNLTGGSGRYDIDARLRTLERRGELRTVANPTLIAISGEPASFRSGGELPVAVPQSSDTIAVQFRPYGASVDVTPTIQSNGVIRLNLNAELSSVDPSVGARVNGVSTPGLSVRRATTIAELQDGESLVIAGLYERRHEDALTGDPVTDAVPVLGGLLRSTNRNETQRELAIVVTASITHAPTPPDPEPELARRSPPSEAAPPEPPTRRLAESGPRGPPVADLVRDVRHLLGRPAHWMKQAAHRIGAFLTRLG